MGGGGKGGDANSSGMYEAMASAQAAQQAYALGEQQLQWTKDVYNQQWPTIFASANAQMALEGQQAKNLEQMTQEAAQQWGTYQQSYLPEELKLIGQVNDWASPGNQALVRGQAMGDIAEQGQRGINTAAETLREYGVNPSAPKYASLYTEAQPMLGAAQAAAGTTAGQNLKLQQLGLESGVVNTGRGLVNATGALTTAGTQAGAAGANAAQGAGSTLEQNLATGSQAMTNPFNWFNAGANNMNTYVNAVNGYNDAQAKMAEASASEMSGMGSAAGGVLGLLKFAAKGGPINKYGLGGDVTQGVPEYGAPDFVGGDERDYLNKANPPAPPPALAYPGDAKNIETHVHPLRSLPHRSFNMADGGNVAMAGGGVSPQGVGAMPGMPSWGGSPAPMPGWGGGAPGGWGGETGVPPGGTPGGAVPVHASPSFGVATDDVPAMLTAHEFVIPKDVATWKGHEFYAKHIDQARKAAQAFANRDDIGGEAAPGIPQAPTFVSRPDHAGGAMGGWEAALGGGQGGDWQTALQGFENKLPQQAQTAIQGFENNFPGGWPPQGAWPTG